MDNDMITLLQILACPECREHGALTFWEPEGDDVNRWSQLLKEEPDVRQALACQSCDRTYPITKDGIPILWSDVLRETFEKLDNEITDTAATELDVKAANINIYEATVDQYHEVGIHADSTTESRFRNALQTSDCDIDGWHLDVGCGGGNVLHMAKRIGFSKGVGVDVSVSGLRLVLKQGFFAVLGDAELLPVKPSAVSLVTASSVLHHLYAPSRLMLEANRVLQVGGLFYTDFDPHKVGADWSWLMRKLYESRLPAYRLMSIFARRRVSHRDRINQTWNKVAEFHNHPGAGFSPSQLFDDLNQSGFKVLMILPHNTLDATVIPGRLSRPTLRHFVVQILSGRNPLLRKNADTLLTLSTKYEA